MQTGVAELQASVHFQIRHSKPDASKLQALIHINANNQLTSAEQNMMLPTKLPQHFATGRNI